jgi:hypothetical protein
MRRWIFVLALGIAAAAGCRSKAGSSSSEGFAAQTTGSSVSFEITPRVYDGNRLTLDIRATTHSGDLSEVDLQKAVLLHAGDREYAPVEVPSLRGHHDGGAIVFEPKQRLEHFAVTIRGVRGIEELRLEW